MRLGAVGDVVRALPVLHALRASGSATHVGWLVEEPAASLLEEQPLDAVHVLPRRTLSRELRRPLHWPRAVGRLAGLRRSLRAERYDLVLDLHGTFKAALAARIAGAPTWGPEPPGSKEGAWRLYHRRLPFPAVQPTRVERALLIAHEAGLLPTAHAPPAVRDGASAAARWARAARFGLEAPAARLAGVASWIAARHRPFVACVPFASRRGQAKRWPIDRHVELARRLAERGADVKLAWGSPGEREEAQAALDAAGALPPGVGLFPPTDLVELAGLLARADLVVTGDTGPMHLAAGVGTPVLALFGPSDARINRPWGDGHEVIVREPLADLPVDEVESRARALLDLRPSPGTGASTAEGSTPEPGPRDTP